MYCTALESFGPLGGVAHHEHGLAQTRRLFLNATGVGKDNGTLFHQIDELQILQGLDEEEIRPREIFAEHLVDGLAHIGVEVHGIDEVHVGIFLAEVFHSGNHTDETFAEVFSSMAGDENEFLASIQTGDIVAGVFQNLNLQVGKGFVGLEFIDHHVQCVDDCVTCDEDLPVGLFLLEVLLAQGCGGEVVRGDASGNLAVHLLRPGAVNVVGS